MDIQSTILDSLRALETQHDVRIVYACESGSRAWGFPSTDSDYDVRFIYVHRQDWYLSIDLERKRDVIELPIEDELDVNGWDLRKALRLFRSSNPPLMEWLGSPIVYLERYSVAARMRALAPTCYSPFACQHHYLRMARGKHEEYLSGERMSLKKCLYVLRPVLALIWLERRMGMVPTEFQKLVDGVVEQRDLKDAIADLLERKKAGAELDSGPKIPAISEFLDRELARLEARRFERRVGDCSLERLNEIFREALEEVRPSQPSVAA